MTSLPLALSLGHVDGLLAHARAAQSFSYTTAADPFLIDLPAYDGGGGEVTQASLEVIGALYFAAEIEATYLPAVAEQLAENRYGLNLTDRGAAEALEKLATEMRHEWVDRRLRNQIFVRCFGIGEADPNLGDTVVNREFEPRFARFCLALVDSARDLGGWGAPSGAAMRAAVAAQALTANLSGRMQGNTLVATERLVRQLNLSITALNHQGLASLFMGRTAWDVVRGVLGPDTPDLQAQVTQAQTGLRLMTWLSRVLPAVQTADAQAIIDAIQGEAGLQGWAELWLDAAGVQTHGAQPGVLQ
jgi:hypothetical protein